MKTLKKILSAVSFLAICIESLTNGVTSNAVDNEKWNTYMIYCTVEANSGIRWADLAFTYTAEVDSMEVEVGDFGGEVTQTNIRRVTGEMSYSASFHTDGIASIIAPGTLFTVKAWSMEDFESSQSEMRTSAFDSSLKFIGLDKFTATTVLVGDANHDGKVEFADATLILQYLTNPTEYKLTDYGAYAADVDFDGIITKKDAELIQKYCSGVIDFFE